MNKKERGIKKNAWGPEIVNRFFQRHDYEPAF